MHLGSAVGAQHRSSPMRSILTIRITWSLDRTPIGLVSILITPARRVSKVLFIPRIRNILSILLSFRKLSPILGYYRTHSASARIPIRSTWLRIRSTAFDFFHSYLSHRSSRFRKCRIRTKTWSWSKLAPAQRRLISPNFPCADRCARFLQNC